jgi:hypothetical protein
MTHQAQDPEIENPYTEDTGEGVQPIPDIEGDVAANPYTTDTGAGVKQVDDIEEGVPSDPYTDGHAA